MFFVRRARPTRRRERKPRLAQKKRSTLMSLPAKKRHLSSASPLPLTHPPHNSFAVIHCHFLNHEGESLSACGAHGRCALRLAGCRAAHETPPPPPALEASNNTPPLALSHARNTPTAQHRRGLHENDGLVVRRHDGAAAGQQHVPWLQVPGHRHRRRLKSPDARRDGRQGVPRTP